MNLVCRNILFFIVIISSIAIAQEKKADKWFSSDKLEHFTVSAFYSGGTAVIANRHFDLKKSKSLIIGIGFTVSLGVAKEVIDAHKPEETSSMKDLVWDIAGALTGALVAGLAL